MELKSYLFSLSYSERLNEKKFIKDVLNTYDKDTITGSMAFINNNPYSLEFLFAITYNGDTESFEKWIVQNYPEKIRKYNYFNEDILQSFFTKGYNGVSLYNEEDVDIYITKDGNLENGIFLFPDKKTMNSMWKVQPVYNSFKVFLSHSSKDKNLVDNLFNELQKNEIRAWYDKYEIKLGDSIIEKVSDGLENCDLGLIFLSKNFIDASTGWTKRELNYFIQRRIESNKKNFIILNHGLSNEELPPLVREYRYLDLSKSESIKELVNTLNEMIEKRNV